MKLWRIRELVVFGLLSPCLYEMYILTVRSGGGGSTRANGGE